MRAVFLEEKHWRWRWKLADVELSFGIVCMDIECTLYSFGID